MMSFRFLDLPAEIRAHVFSYLLPNVPVIHCDTAQSFNEERHIGLENPYTYEDPLWIFVQSFARYDDPFFPQILRVNRQLHSEAVAYLYHQRTFVLTIYQFGFDFLKQSGPLNVLPILPYGEIMHFVIQIKACDIRTAGRQVRKNLIRLCGLIHEQNIHFKKLTVDFLNHGSVYSDREADGHETEAEMEEHIPSLWEFCHDAPKNIPPEIADAAWGHQNFEYAAWYLGWGLTFAYLMSPLMMLSGVADQAIIQIPDFCTGNPRYEMLKRYYEERLQGRYGFDEDDPDLIGLRWAFKHPYGPRKYCEDMCMDCHAFTMQMKRKRKEDAERVKREWDEDLEMWERFPGADDLYLTSWQKGRRRCMQYLEGCCGAELGNRIYHWIFPKSWRWRVWYGMIPSRLRQPEVRW